MKAYEFFTELWANQVDKSNDMILVSAIEYLIEQIRDNEVRRAYERAQDTVRQIVGKWEIDVSFIKEADSDA